MALYYRKKLGLAVADDSCTYAIWDGTAIKVGKSCESLKKRLDGLQTGNPRELRLVAYTTSVTEAQAHERLSQWHVRGEWFRHCPEVVREISSWSTVDDSVIEAIRLAWTEDHFGA